MKSSFFLDSGAYTAWTKKININIDKYIQFIKDNEEYLDVYANLDVIGDKDGEKSYEAWKYMRSKGINPLPVFHAHADPKYLLLYMKEVDYIAIGAISEMFTKQRVLSMDKTWRDYLLDEKGFPKIRCHGFGLTSTEIMARYPWYSVDSMSWSLMGAYGSIIIPPKVNGKRKFTMTPYKVFISNQSSAQGDLDKHFDTLTETAQQDVLEYLEENGFCMGESEIIDVAEDYILQDGESWFNADRTQIQIIKKLGVINSYKERASVNITYYQGFAKSQPIWPWSIYIQDTAVSKKGFGLAPALIPDGIGPEISVPNKEPIKVYFAGTRSRESMGLNERLNVKNHLESYLTFMAGDPKKFFNKLLNKEKIS